MLPIKNRIMTLHNPKKTMMKGLLMVNRMIRIHRRVTMIGS